MAQNYKPINFDLWRIFKDVPALHRQTAVLVHIFEVGDSALFVTDDDSVYAVGSNRSGRLGIGDVDTTSTPVEIPFLENKRVKYFATGRCHMIALTESGDLFSWGWNEYGQLGDGTKIDRRTPGRVLLQDGDRIEAIACGACYSLALTTEHKLLNWGVVQCSVGTGQNIPCELRIDCSGFVCEIACGGWHAAAMTNEGLVYTWGQNYEGQLGREADEVDAIPTLIDRSLSVPAVSIGCGFYSTIVLNSNRKLESWGYLKDLDKLDCPPIDSIMVTNDMDIFAMKCGEELFCYGRFKESKGVPLWVLDRSVEYSLQRIKAETLQNAFAPWSTPQFVRAVETLVGPARDLYGALFDRKELSDLAIKLSDGVVHVHKLILMTFCEHFKTMLLGSWADETKNELDMVAYNPKAYRAFLKFVYSGKLESLLGPELIDLYMIAQSYFEAELKSMAVAMFRKRLNPENVSHWYSLAHKGQCEELIEICYEFASGCVDQVVLSDAFEKLSPELSKSLVVESAKKKNSNRKKPRLE